MWTFQVSWISRSRFPRLRAVEALAISLPLFLLLFSGTYVAMAAVSAGNFGQKLTHTDALYFCVGTCVRLIPLLRRCGERFGSETIDAW
jgi:hypothetical protein